jgi:tRNA (guanine37-N1)-methyltransferase
MRLDVLTLFPAMVEGPLAESIIGRARAAGLFELGVHDIRAHGLGRHRTVDDAPYGGGSGMVMRVDVLDAAIGAVRRPDSHVVLFEPSGTRFDQRMAERFAALPHLVLVCGHYEGIDARVRDHLVDEVVSIGDYVLTGGEYAALVVVDATARLLPGVLGNGESASDESFSDGLLEYPHYTRPREHRGWGVPDILLSGDHGRVAAWRKEQSRQRTIALRPDLPVPELPPARKRRRKAPKAAAGPEGAASVESGGSSTVDDGQGTE